MQQSGRYTRIAHTHTFDLLHTLEMYQIEGQGLMNFKTFSSFRFNLLVPHN